ncbi:MAG TPA: PIG-L deacetylase family protein [Desulfomonilaceae bacterium]|nr:PIG-L deacetylase family protein [Desulfomonilaceae bacterium]
MLDSSSRYLFMLAHPDDEVLIAGTMKQLLDQGAEIYGAWVTCGEYFGNIESRLAEHTRAMSVLGLKDSSVNLLKLPDLGLVSMLNVAAERVADLLKTIKPDVIFANAYEGGHPDHDAVNFLAYEGSLRAGVRPQLYEFPLYNATGSRLYCRWRINGFPDNNIPPLYNPLNYPEIRCRFRMIRTYVSQWMYMIPARLVASRSRLAAVGEPYRACPADRDHTVPPHEGMLSYERWVNSFMRTKFEDFRNSVEHARQSRSA